MVETQSIVARQSSSSKNFVVYEAAEPDVPTDDFVQALSGMYINKEVFRQQDIEAPEIIEVTVGENEPLTLQPDGESRTTRSFTSAHELDGRDVICSMYLAHRLYESEQVPEELSVSIDMSASLEDWEQSVEQVEEEFGTVETDDADDEISGFVFGTSEGTPTSDDSSEVSQNDSDGSDETDDESSSEADETSSEVSDDGSDESEQELEEIVES